MAYNLLSRNLAPAVRIRFVGFNIVEMKRVTKNQIPGFTLVELLVVIAVIAVLAALLLSVLAGAKARALSAVCKSNLRQIGIALRMYVDDFQAYPPRAGYAVPISPVSQERGPSITSSDLMLALAPYLPRQSRVFLCPVTERHGVVYGLGNGSSQVQFNAGTNIKTFFGAYGYNGFGTAFKNRDVLLGLGWSEWVEGRWVDWTVAESAVKHSAEMIALGDQARLTSFQGRDGDTDADIFFGFTFSPNVSGLYSPALPAKRHNQGANLVFCDTHVEYSKYDKLVEAADKPRRRWNNDNEPHREAW